MHDALQLSAEHGDDAEVPGALTPLDREDMIHVQRIARTGNVWIAAVASCALVATMAVWWQHPPWHGVTDTPALIAVAAALILIGELMSIDVARRDETTTLANMSMVIAVAMIAIGPIALLLAIEVVAVVADDLRNRRAGFKLVFNASQYVLSLVAARAAYCLVAGVPFMSGPTLVGLDDVPAILVAGLAYLVVNEGLVSVTYSVIIEEPVWPSLLNDIRMTAPITLVMVGSAPLAAYLLSNALPLVPLLLLPALAVWYSSQVAAQRHRVSLQDPLTGLANRSLLYRKMGKALSERDDGGEPVALLMMDVDHFKDVNDVLGHHTGDLLLIELGTRVSNLVRTGEVVSRLGGDEFALLLRGHDVADRATRVARRLLADLNEPLDLRGVRLAVQCSVGVVVVAESGLDAEELVKRADIALYEAKRERASVSVYTTQASDAAAERLSLLPDLRDAVAQGSLQVHYQPLIDGASGTMVGAEALCRWRHPAHGWVSPANFVPLAESTGLIQPLTRFVLEQALIAARGWMDLGLDLRLSVNLSTRLVSDSALPGLVADLLTRHQVPPERLTIEVTESGVFNDPSRATVILGELRRIGIRLSMDDFGTGYSSLALLQRLDVDELKIDRSFVSTMDRVAGDAILVRSTIDLAHSLGLSVVAEGVDSEVVAGELRLMGCDRLQGHLFGQAMTASDLSRLAHDSDQSHYRTQVVDLQALERRRGTGSIRWSGMASGTLGK